MLPLPLVAAVSFAEGQPGAGASHEVPAGTRTVEQLAGDFPVGRWECWFEARNFADITTSTTAIVPLRCHISLHINASVAELQPGGIGWILGINSPDAQSGDYDAAAAFQVAGAGNLYSRGGDPLVHGAGARLEKLLRRHRERLPRDTAHTEREVGRASAGARRDALD